MRAKRLRSIISSLLVLSLIVVPFFGAEACNSLSEESRQVTTQD